MMQETRKSEIRLKRRWSAATIAATLLGAAVLCHPQAGLAGLRAGELRGAALGGPHPGGFPHRP